MAAIDGAEHLPHAGLVDAAGSEGDGLVGQRQAVTHRAACRPRQQAQCCTFGIDVFVAQHP